MTCPNCGALLEAGLPRCPYCGTLFAEGAEREYMASLQTIRHSMDALSAAPGAGVKKELRRQGRRIRRAALITLSLALLLALLFFLLDRRWERDNTADYIWQHENYPHMTELYEQGAWEELKDFVFTAMDEDKPIWDWEYSDEFWERLEEEE